MSSPRSPPGAKCAQQPPPKETPRPEGAACDKDAQCITGLCESINGAPSKCIRPCSVGCHELEVCEPINLRYGCVPEKAGLCKKCEKDTDCGEGNTCVANPFVTDPNLLLPSKCVVPVVIDLSMPAKDMSAPRDGGTPTDAQAGG